MTPALTDLPPWAALFAATIAEHVALAMRSPPEPDYLDREQLAVKLQVSSRTIANWVSEGALPPGQRVGSKVLRWHWKTVQQWLQSRPRRRVKPACRKAVGA